MSKPVLIEQDEVGVMEALGTKFADVFFVDAGGMVFHEKHVDGVTLLHTVELTLERFKGSKAVVPDGGSWLVQWHQRETGPDQSKALRSKRFPNKEAAEMFAIHSG